MPDNPVAIQLHSLRAETRIDFVGTLRQVATMGYGAVELRGTAGMSAGALRTILDDLGLQVAGCHVGLKQLERDLDATIADALTLNCRYLVCSKLPIGRGRSRAAGWAAAARLFNDIGAACQRHGLQFCYHNHAFEFRRFGGQTALELLVAQTDPALVHFELDVYWARYAGHDPAALIRRLAGRVPLLHLKDMQGRFRRGFCELGSGNIDFPAIFAAAATAGSRWFIVEQDRFNRPPLESVRRSLEYLRARGYA